MSQVATSGQHAERPAKPRLEYYIKWKDRSYMHCTWTSQESLQAAREQYPSTIGVKIRKYFQETDAAQVCLLTYTVRHILNFCEHKAGVCTWDCTAKRCVTDRHLLADNIPCKIVSPPGMGTHLPSCVSSGPSAKGICGMHRLLGREPHRLAHGKMASTRIL